MNASRRILVLTILAAVAASPVRAADPSDAMSKGRLEADLGHWDKATALFTSVADDVTAASTLRAEAMCRLGWVRAAAGDRAGAVKAYGTVLDRFGTDEQAVQKLVGAIAGLRVPEARWERIWKDVRIKANAHPKMHAASIVWPGQDAAECAPPNGPGQIVSVDFKQARLTDVMKFLSDFTGTSIAADACLDGLKIDIQLWELPWDEVLRVISGAYGLNCRRQGDGMAIGCGPDTPLATGGETGTGSCFYMAFADEPIPAEIPTDPDVCIGPMPCEGFRSRFSLAGADRDADPAVIGVGIARLLERSPDLAGQVIHICGEALSLGQVTMVVSGLGSNDAFSTVDLKGTKQLPSGRFRFHVTTTWTGPAAR